MGQELEQYVRIMSQARYARFKRVKEREQKIRDPTFFLHCASLATLARLPKQQQQQFYL